MQVCLLLRVAGGSSSTVVQAKHVSHVGEVLFMRPGARSCALLGKMHGVSLLLVLLVLGILHMHLLLLLSC